MDKVRNGRFTSSKIFKLMSSGRAKDSFGDPFYTYIEEKKFERKLKRSLETRVFDRAMSWGSFVEGYVFEKKLPLNYLMCSKKTLQHPEIDYFVGTPDVEAMNTVGDIKCPYTLKSFCQFAECRDENDLRKVQHSSHKAGEQYFWQLVANAILTGTQYAELIVYCPYFNDLTEIQDRASVADDEFKWIFMADIETLPYIHKDSEYKDLNILRFDAEPYKQQLIDRVIEAEKLLNA